MSEAARIFFSYSHKDEGLRDELEVHLSPLRRSGLIASWHDRRIPAGGDWSGEIDAHLEQADIILLLVSADFIHSDYCFDTEMMRALERHRAREAVVVPVFLRPCRWQDAPFAAIQGVPKDAKPVTDWESSDAAFTDVVDAIHKVAIQIRAKREGPRPTLSAPTPSTHAPAKPVATQSPQTSFVLLLDLGSPHRERVMEATSVRAEGPRIAISLLVDDGADQAFLKQLGSSSGQAAVAYGDTATFVRVRNTTFEQSGRRRHAEVALAGC